METTYSIQATKLKTGCENEPDHRGDFGKMSARTGDPWMDPLDGCAAISVNEDQNDHLKVIPPMK